MLENTIDLSEKAISIITSNLSYNCSRSNEFEENGIYVVAHIDIRGYELKSLDVELYEDDEELIVPPYIRQALEAEIQEELQRIEEEDNDQSEFYRYLWDCCLYG